MTPEQEPSAVLYRRWLQELWAGRSGVVRDLVAEEFVGHWPGGQVRGPDELVAVVEQTRAMVPDLELTLELGPLVDGDLVAARWTGRGRTEQGPVSFVGHDLLRVVHGSRGSRPSIVEYWPATLTDQQPPRSPAPPQA